MIRWQSLTVVACTALVLGACDWRTFDELSDEAWAHSAGSPSDLNSGEFANNLAFSGGGDGVAFVVSGQRPDGVAMIAYDGAGALTSSGESILAGGGATNPDTLPARPAMAGDASSTEGAIAIGLAENGFTTGRVLVYRPSGPSLLQSIPVGAGLVSALAFGATNKAANPTATDIIATTGDQVNVLGGYELESAMRTTASCGFGRARAFAAAVADLDPSLAENEIILAIGNDSMSGAASKILILDGLTVEAADADLTDTSCVANGRTAIVELAAPGDEPDFGAAVVVADFDGSGGLDLAVGAPSSNKVYIYMNIDVTAPAAPTEVSGPSGSGRFGETLAAGDFDNDGNDELVVGDPGADVDGASNAGRAYIIPSDGDFGTVFTLGDASPEADQSFGRGLAVGSFSGSGTALAVAARNEVFTYFRTALSNDVRQR
ncbi:MAG TPA: VCBS repeat-containing protein [Kofleriaceae bacterium]|nr:VCBS repeat-containing protein [Kofleriaceae bacterium]